MPPRSSKTQTSYGRLWWLLAALVASFAAHVLWYRADSVKELVQGAIGPSGWNWAVLSVVFASAMMLWRIVLAASYRPMQSVTDDELPIVTVIIPAFNEGRQVLSTIESVVASDYPREKLSIIAVDDGSKDDTWHWIQRGGQQFQGLVEPIRCPRNRGKRHALHEGIKRSRGQVLVTIDSDSEVKSDTLRNLVSPFVLDERVGAVAGNVRVLNSKKPLAKMLDVLYTYSFEFMRAGQSQLGSVFCTPGALSAYRRDLALGVLDAWVGQTFLGRQANIGEDRAMTNLILRAGYHTKFQGNAIVETEVPTRWRPLSRMFSRWARSNVRETYLMARYVFTRFRTGSTAGTRLYYLDSAINLLFAAVWWVPLAVLLALKPLYAVPALAMGATITGLPSVMVYALLRGPGKALYGLAYSVYSLFLLSWITPYAFLSLRQNGWLTRQTPSAAVTPLHAQPQPAMRRRRAVTAA